MNELCRNDIELSLNVIERELVPHNRKATKYCLSERGKHWPSKYVVRRAFQLRFPGVPAEGRFHGGSQIIGILEHLGYTIVKNGHPEMPNCQNWCLKQSRSKAVSRVPHFRGLGYA